MSPQFAVLLLLTVAINAGLGLMVPIAPNYLKDIGFSTAALSLPFLGLVLARVMSKAWVGLFLRYTSHTRLLQISFLTYAVAFFIYPLLRSPWTLTSIRLLEGCAEGVASAVLMDLAVAMTSTSKRRGELMGYFSAAFGLGFMVGPAVGMVAQTLGGQQFVFLVGGCIGLLGAAGCFAMRRDHLKRPSMASGPIASLRHAWNYRQMLPYYIPQILRRALLFAFMIALPLTAHETLNVPSSRVGGFFILSALITTFLMPFAGKLADRIAPASLVVVTMLVMGLTIVCFGLAHRLPAFSALFVVETIAFAFMQPAGMKVFANIVDKHPERSNVVGVFGSIAELSTVPVALIVPPLFAAAPALSWVAIGLPCLVGALPFMRYRPPIAAAVTQDTMANPKPMRPPQ